jgi:hypothetical protein
METKAEQAEFRHFGLSEIHERLLFMAYNTKQHTSRPKYSRFFEPPSGIVTRRFKEATGEQGAEHVHTLCGKAPKLGELTIGMPVIDDGARAKSRRESIRREDGSGVIQVGLWQPLKTHLPDEELRPAVRRAPGGKIPRLFGINLFGSEEVGHRRGSSYR